MFLTDNTVGSADVKKETGINAKIARYLITQNTINSLNRATQHDRNPLFEYLPGELFRIIGFIVFTLGMTTGLIPAAINGILNFIQF